MNKIKVKKNFFGNYHVPLINPKTGLGKLTTPETKALIFGLISEVHRIIIYM